jgi:Flp pilus assembly protein TadG
MKRIQRLRRDQSGMSLVFIGLGMMAFVSASMLAIDVGMLMTARSQAQNSADAGALAGATALLYDSYTDRSAGGPAVTSAIRASQMNNVMSGQVSVTPGDVEFLNSPTSGEPNRVKVSVRRTASRGNPVATMIARYFGMANTDIGAVATAEASPANAMDCVKPFTIPDKWIEKQTPPWDPANDTYDAFNNKGVPLANPDIYIPAYNADGSPNSNYTGYRMFPAYPGGPTDVGTVLTIRAGIGNNISPSFYFSLAMTDDTGGSDYRWNIANCNTHHYLPGSLLVQEPGAMSGPTTQGIDELIARDSSARYNPTTQKIDFSAFGNHSPRVFPIPLYDPIYYDEGKRNGRNADLKTANWICFFADSVTGQDIKGIIVPCMGIYDKNGPAPNSAMPKTIRLVQ